MTWCLNPEDHKHKQVLSEIWGSHSLTEVTKETTVIWDITPSSLVQSTDISEVLLPLLSGQAGWRQQDALIYL